MSTRFKTSESLFLMAAGNNKFFGGENRFI